MQLLSNGSTHRQACTLKQTERERKILSLSKNYSAPLTLAEKKIHDLSISELVAECRSGALRPATILEIYLKRALCSQQATNCLSDVMFEDALAIPAFADCIPRSRGEFAEDQPGLLGVPISIKDTVDIIGYDSTIGFSKNVGQPAETSSAIVKLLQDAGALLHVKTTVPTGLISLETTSHMFGRTDNPYNREHTAGASTGGGAALVAGGGSKIEIGTDIAGSVRIPAHFCGIWSIKGSSERFPSWGSRSSMPGLDSIPLVVSPMASNLADLREFCKRVILAEPWQYDHSTKCVPLPWRSIDLQEKDRKLKWGVIWDDGTIPPTPACQRALCLVVAALRKHGHEVVNFSPPDISEGLNIGYQLLFSDGGVQIRNALQRGEEVTPAAKEMLDLLSLPRLIKKLLSFSVHLKDPLASRLYATMHTKTVLEDRENVVARDQYRAAWHRSWAESELDFVITVPTAFPAPKHGDSAKLDYTAGVMPVTHVNKSLDRLPQDFTDSEEYQRLSVAAKGAYLAYDADKMHGLPVGIQVVGRRLEEEKVLDGMQVIEIALRNLGIVFVNKATI